jgi:ABC-type nitrate/sulfonate/bicarbonate transport system substrate-binding protein
MRLRILAVVALALVAPLTGIVATGGSAQAASTSSTSKPNTPAPKPLPTMTTVVISEPAKVENFAALPVAVAEGEFAKTNLKVTIIADAGGANAEPQELAQGSVQAVETGIGASFLNAINSGVTVVYVGNPDYPNPKTKAGFWVNKTFLTKKGTFDAAKATTFKMSLGTAGVASSGAAQAQAWLEKSKESLSKVTQETLSPPTMVLALEHGSLGGGYVNAPYWTELSADATLVDVASPPYATGVVAMYRPWVQSHKAEAAAIVRSLIRTDRTYLTSKYRSTSKVMSIISTYLGIPVTTIDQSDPVVFSQNYSMTSVPAVMKGHALPTTTVLQLNQKGWIQATGILQYTKPIPSKKLITTAVLQAALK